MSKQSVDLLHGDIKSALLKFALPLFLGQVFQQMYNMVDALVVGNLCGENALAAVTSTGSLIFLIVGFFGGVYGGVGVVIARCYGAGDEYQVKRAVGTAVLGTVISGAFLTLLGVFGSPVLLRWNYMIENANFKSVKLSNDFKLNDINYMFYYYAGKKLDLSDWDMSEITTMQYAFYGTELEELTIGYTPKLRTIRNAFSSSTELRKLSAVHCAEMWDTYNAFKGL